MKIDLTSIIRAFDCCTTMRLQEIIVDAKAIRFLTSEGAYEAPADVTEEWIKKHGQD